MLVFASEGSSDTTYALPSIYNFFLCLVMLSTFSFGLRRARLPIAVLEPSLKRRALLLLRARQIPAGPDRQTVPTFWERNTFLDSAQVAVMLCLLGWFALEV